MMGGSGGVKDVQAGGKSLNQIQTEFETSRDSNRARTSEHVRQGVIKGVSEEAV